MPQEATPLPANGSVSMADCSVAALAEFVEVTPQRAGGSPVLKGTRFTLAQLLGQLGDGDSLNEVAENFDLDREQLSGVLHALAAHFDRTGTFVSAYDRGR